jgi:PilZ domain
MAELGRGAGGRPRAARFNLRIPIRYRASGEAVWDEGTTENISRTGVLFQAERLLKEGTSVDMSFVLPVEMAGETRAEVSCRGRIVRVQPDVGARTALAATISNYHFGRGREKRGV